MAFNSFVWNLYKDSEGGKKAIASALTLDDDLPNDSRRLIELVRDRSSGATIGGADDALTFFEELTAGGLSLRGYPRATAKSLR